MNFAGFLRVEIICCFWRPGIPFCYCTIIRSLTFKLCPLLLMQKPFF